MKPLHIIEAVTAFEAVEALMHQMERMGAEGVYSEEADGAWSVSGCFALSDDAEARVRQTRAALAQIQACGLETAPGRVSSRTFKKTDWTDWRSYFPPQRFGDTLLVAPSWEPLPADAPRAVVRLDPGMVFGTGRHESTRLCLQALAEAEIGGKTALDLGCGSGILAVAAAKLGAARCLAVDIDPNAIPVAEANARQNGVSDRVETRQGSAAEIDERFDLLLMNILAPTIVQEMPHLSGLLKRGGRAVFSGFTDDEAPGLSAALQEGGWAVLRALTLNEWSALEAAVPNNNHPMKNKS